MASGRKSNKTVIVTEERKNTKVVCCMDCLWANLIQYGNDPIIAECYKSPDPDNEKFPYERQVASAKWVCPTWKHDDKVKSIEKREKVA